MPTSTVLRDLLHRASTETITLAWLMDQLGERSFALKMQDDGVARHVLVRSGDLTGRRRQ
jgi:hypothetical protein